MRKASISGNAKTGEYDNESGYVANVERKAQHRELMKDIKKKSRQLESARDKAAAGDTVLVRQREESRVSMLERELENLKRQASDLERQTLAEAWSEPEPNAELADLEAEMAGFE